MRSASQQNTQHSMARYSSASLFCSHLDGEPASTGSRADGPLPWCPRARPRGLVGVQPSARAAAGESHMGKRAPSFRARAPSSKGWHGPLVGPGVGEGPAAGRYRCLFRGPRPHQAPLRPPTLPNIMPEARARGPRGPVRSALLAQPCGCLFTRAAFEASLV